MCCYIASIRPVMPSKHVLNENLNTQNTNKQKKRVVNWTELLCMQYYFTAVFISAAGREKSKALIIRNIENNKINKKMCTVPHMLSLQLLPQCFKWAWLWSELENSEKQPKTFTTMSRNSSNTPVQTTQPTWIAKALYFKYKRSASAVARYCGEKMFLFFFSIHAFRWNAWSYTVASLRVFTFSTVFPQYFSLSTLYNPPDGSVCVQVFFVHTKYVLTTMEADASPYRSKRKQNWDATSKLRFPVRTYSGNNTWENVSENIQTTSPLVFIRITFSRFSSV